MIEKLAFQSFKDRVYYIKKGKDRGGLQMSANIAIGVQDFSTLIENHHFYVDKTDFIKEWWDCGDSVDCGLSWRKKQWESM